jgi:hypothetical protein
MPNAPKAKAKSPMGTGISLYDRKYYICRVESFNKSWQCNAFADLPTEVKQRLLRQGFVI